MTRSKTARPIRRAIAWIVGLLGLGLIGLGAAALAHDWFAASDEAGFRVLTFGEWWFEIDRASLNTFQAVVQRYVHPEAWDPVFTTAVLFQPAWLVAVVPGVLFVLLAMLIGRRRRG